MNTTPCEWRAWSKFRRRGGEAGFEVSVGTRERPQLPPRTRWSAAGGLPAQHGPATAWSLGCMRAGRVMASDVTPAWLMEVCRDVATSMLHLG